MVARPKLLMNLNGRCVAGAYRKYGIRAPTDVLLVRLLHLHHIGSLPLATTTTPALPLAVLLAPDTLHPSARTPARTPAHSVSFGRLSFELLVVGCWLRALFVSFNADQNGRTQTARPLGERGSKFTMHIYTTLTNPIKSNPPTSHLQPPTNSRKVHDDLDREFGKHSIKHGGSANGHNGVKSSIGMLQSDTMKRLRVGIGRPKNQNAVTRQVPCKHAAETNACSAKSLGSQNLCVSFFLESALLGFGVDYLRRGGGRTLFNVRADAYVALHNDVRYTGMF